MIPPPDYSRIFMITFYNDLCNNSLKIDKHTLTCSRYNFNNGVTPIECCNNFMTTTFGKTYELDKCYNHSLNTTFSNMFIQCYEPNYDKGSYTAFLIILGILIGLYCLYNIVSYFKENKHKNQINKMNINTTYGTLNNEIKL